MRSQSVDDYLKAIYMLQEEHNGQIVSTSSLAVRLAVANASVTGMLKRFSQSTPKLVEYEPYSGVTLTKAGRKMAVEVIRHHRLLECYLNQKLGYSWDEVHEEADRLEHVISEKMEERMALLLGDPTADPHGDPIPDRNGNFPQPNYLPLADVPDGQVAEIRRVVGQESDLLRYLTSLGLVLSTRFKMLSKAPFNGPVVIRVIGAGQSELALGREISKQIQVQLIPSASTEKTYEQFNHEK